MKNFICGCARENTLFFESTQCTACGRMVGYCADTQRMLAFDDEGDEQHWLSVEPAPQRYRQCGNYSEHQVCNWMVPEYDPNLLCRACRLNDVIPDLSLPQNLLYWRKLEAAKRRALYTVFALGLPISAKRDDPEQGLLFRFMADKDPHSEFTVPLSGLDPIYTGHERGEITINLAEADDVARTRARVQMGEGYRTLLGHFRHELGHYYWNRLVEQNPVYLDTFRELFGDERQDYNAAREQYYHAGPPSDWSQQCISAYAAMHPWEDWAESWAHYMHMIDSLDTAHAFQLQLDGTPLPSEDVTDPPRQGNTEAKADALQREWMRLAVGMNALNRSMGVADAYPFVLTEPIRQKLRWIYRLVVEYPGEMLPTLDDPQVAVG